MSVLTHSNNINFEVCHRVLSQSVYALLSLIQAMLNMSTLSTNDQGESFWELVCGSVNQVLADQKLALACFRRLRQLCRRPFPVTLQRIFNTRFKKLLLVVFCCNFWTLRRKPHHYICSGCKNMVSQKCTVFIGPPCIMQLSGMSHCVPKANVADFLSVAKLQICWISWF